MRPRFHFHVQTQSAHMLWNCLLLISRKHLLRLTRGRKPRKEDSRNVKEQNTPQVSHLCTNTTEDVRIGRNCLSYSIYTFPVFLPSFSVTFLLLPLYWVSLLRGNIIINRLSILCIPVHRLHRTHYVHVSVHRLYIGIIIYLYCTYVYIGYIYDSLCTCTVHICT